MVVGEDSLAGVAETGELLDDVTAPPEPKIGTEPAGTELFEFAGVAFDGIPAEAEAGTLELGELVGVATEADAGNPKLAELEGETEAGPVVGRTPPGADDEDTSVAVTGHIVVETETVNLDHEKS